MHIQTDHQIVALGHNLMQLVDNASGDVHASAQRLGDEWVVSAPGSDKVKDISRATRREAVEQMIEHALEALPGTGYSTSWHPSLATLD